MKVPVSVMIGCLQLLTRSLTAQIDQLLHGVTAGDSDMHLHHDVLVDDAALYEVVSCVWRSCAIFSTDTVLGLHCTQTVHGSLAL